MGHLYFHHLHQHLITLFHHHNILLHRHHPRHLISFINHNIFHHHHRYLTSFITTRPSATKGQPSTHFGKMKRRNTKTKPEKEQVLEDIDTAIYEIPEPPKLEIVEPLLNFLSTDAENILTDDCVNDKELQDKTLEQIKEEN